MNSLITWWIKNKIAGNILMIFIIISGFITYFYVNKETFPTGKFPVASISVSWPGASPREIEEQILVRLENAYLGLDNLKEIRSTAYEGSGSVFVIAKLGSPINTFLNDVKLRTDSVRNLPQSSYTPRVKLEEEQDSALSIAVYGHVSQKDLQNTARNIRDDINKLPGNAIAKVEQERTEEISIEIPEQTLKQYNLTFDQVSRAIRLNSLNQSSGEIRSPAGTLKMTTRKRAQTPKDFEAIILKQTIDGRVIRIGDIATVKDSYIETNFLSEYNGEKAVFINIELGKQKSNIVKVSKSVKKYLEKNKNTHPNIKVEITKDEADFYKSQMNTLGSSAITGLILVLIVLLLFLHPIVAIWVSVGIVTAFAGAFIFLPVTHVSLNMLSFFAFILVIGIIVDDALIVGESIYLHFERGERGEKAAINGTLVVAKPVIFAVITTIMIFLPWMLVKGVSQFTRSVSIVVILALTFSLFESLFILPGHLSHLRTKTYGGFLGWLSRQQKRIANSLITFSYSIYRPVLSFCIQFRYLTLAIFSSLLILSVGLVLSGTVPFQFLPEIESSSLNIEIRFPANTDNRKILEARKKLVAAKEKLKKNYNQFETSLVENMTLSIYNTSIHAHIKVIDPKKRNNIPMSEITDKFKTYLGEVPLAKKVDIGFIFTGEDKNRLSVTLFAKDTSALEKAKEELKAHLRTYSSTYSVRDSGESNTKELHFSLKPGAASTGLTLSDVSNQIREAYYGIIVQRIARNGQDVEVRLRYPKTERSNLDSLENFRVRTKNGKKVPLLSVVGYTYENSIRSIHRQDHKRTIRVSADIIGKNNKKILTHNLETKFLKEMLQKYPGVKYEFSGGRKETKNFAKEMFVLTGLVLFLMYALLAIAFKSYFQPLLIMSAILFAFTGAIYGLFFLGTPLAMFSFFGIAAAAGVIINDNLILIDFVNRLREKGLGAFQALIDAGIARFRPILLTSLTTFVGILPLIIEKSTQAQFLKPMVISLGAGILFAFFLTLFLIPALYAIGIDFLRFCRWVLTGKEQEKLGTNYDPDIHHIKAQIEETI